MWFFQKFRIISGKFFVNCFDVGNRITPFGSGGIHNMDHDSGTLDMT